MNSTAHEADIDPVGSPAEAVYAKLATPAERARVRAESVEEQGDPMAFLFPQNRGGQSHLRIRRP